MQAHEGSTQERSTRSGDWLFRWRSFLPLAFAAVLIPAFREFTYFLGSQQMQLIWSFVCLGISFLGLAIRVHAVGHAPRGTSGRNTRSQIAETLNTTGMYSVSRNPLYLGNFLMMLGPVLCLHVWWSAVIFVLVFWLYYERIIMAEEAFLLDRFGDVYRRYLASTPVFLPAWALWRPPALPFSTRNVLRREYSGFFALMAVFAVLDAAGDLVVTGRVRWDPVWIPLFLFGLVVYLTLRTLKKTTQILHVEGR